MTVFGFGGCTGGLPLYFVSKNFFGFIIRVYIIAKADFYMWFFNILEKIIPRELNWIVQLLGKLHYTHSFESVQL